MEEILVSLGICPVLPAMIVRLVMRTRQNEANRKTEIMLKAIEARTIIDAEFFKSHLFLFMPLNIFSQYLFILTNICNIANINTCRMNEKLLCRCTSIISVCILLLLNACNHPDLDIQFNKETDIVIPAEGGAYYFEVEAIEAVETKTSFGNFLRAFEYRVTVGESIIDQQLLQIREHNDYIEPGDKFKVDFDVPENVTSEERNVRVEILLAKDQSVYDRFYGNDDHVDPGDNTWETVWEAIQLAY